MKATSIHLKKIIKGGRIKKGSEDEEEEKEEEGDNQ